MNHRRLWAAFCVIALFPVLLAAQSFTLQQVMSAPFNSQLKVSPVGQRLVWVADQQGRRNLWIAEAGSDGSYTARPLTQYDADDGPRAANRERWLRGGARRSPRTGRFWPIC
jgi:hypothetical protein